VVDFGIRGLDLTYALLDGPELTILVDVVSRGGAPGTLYTIEPDVENLGDFSRQTPDAHTMDPLSVLRAVKAMGGTIGRILLVGCEPGDLGEAEGLMGLTPAVSAAVEQAAVLVECLIEKEMEKV
jgi:hydrogenase maturation protease